jgi:hypothetical protein
MAGFFCKSYKLTIPADKQRGFCAKQFRLDRDICRDCDRGKAAAGEERQEILASLPEQVRSEIDLRANAGRKETDVAGKQLCSDGCGKRAVKEGLAFKCYKQKYGKAPWDTGQSKAKAGKKKSSGTKRAARARRAKGNGHECEGCKVLSLQLEEIGRVEKIMVAAGLVPAEKFDHARKIVRELSK